VSTSSQATPSDAVERAAEAGTTVRSWASKRTELNCLSDILQTASAYVFAVADEEVPLVENAKLIPHAECLKLRPLGLCQSMFRTIQRNSHDTS